MKTPRMRSSHGDAVKTMLLVSSPPWHEWHWGMIEMGHCKIGEYLDADDKTVDQVTFLAKVNSILLLYRRFDQS